MPANSGRHSSESWKSDECHEMCDIIVEGLETNQTASALVRTEVQLTIKRCPQVLLLNDLTTNSLKLYSNLKTKLLCSKLKKKDSKSKLEGMG